MNEILRPGIHDVVSALAYSLAAEQAGSSGPLGPPYNDVVQFVLRQHARMSDPLQAPLAAVTHGFDWLGLLHGLERFRHQSPERRRRQIETWRNSRLGFQRDFIRFYESLVTLALHSRTVTSDTEAQGSLSAGVVTEPKDELRCEIAVVGSGPGGSITACLLAESGRDVLLIEEGPFASLESTPAFSVCEMEQKYRNGGLTVAMGQTKIAYVEGRCVGGGSEINSGLYHRTPPEILDQWRREFEVEALSESDLRPHFEACERDVFVSKLPGAAPAASLKLHEGAERLGWKSLEVPRWFRYEDTPPGAAPRGTRQSMTRTFVPRFLAAGGRLLPGTRVRRLVRDGNWELETERANGSRGRISAETVFVCAGAVQTPALLRRSGLKKNIGNSLHLHPTAKLVACFPDQINAHHMGVPVHQVKEFSPRLSFGCSISSEPYLGLGLLDFPDTLRDVPRQWPHLATYYAMITGEGCGTVRTLPGFRDPLVRYLVTRTDRRDLMDGLRKLSEALFAAGAAEIYPAVPGGRILRGPEEARQLPDEFPAGGGGLMTIHLFSSCPMGERKDKCAADSFGRVHEAKNLFIADASLLCGAPGVNPQGTIMAIARRNALQFVDG
jgi:choline dehydrogenase-like flavoprotein